jgi:type I restriction enzyme S subunit
MKVQIVNLGDVCNLVNGKAYNTLDWATEGVPIIRIQNLNDADKPFNYWNGLLDRQVQVNPGDILLAWSGTPGTSFGAHVWLRSKGVLNQHIFRVDIDRTRITGEWAVTCINHLLHRLIDQAHGGVGLQHVTKPMVQGLQIPLPQVSEQQRLTAILDKAASIRRKREEGIGLTDELLRSTFLEMFGDPLTNERRWPRKPMSEILDNIDSGWSPKCHDRRAEEGEWAVLKLGAVTYCEYQPEENKALPEAEQPQPALEVKAGDLLMTRKNTYDLVAASAFVFDTPPKLMLPDLIFRLRIKDKAPVRAEYLWGLLTHPGKRRSIQSLAGGTAGSMPNISKAKLLDHLVELPPKPQQDKFADFMHAHRRMRCKRQELAAEQSSMFAALVQRAFRGEL